MYKIPVVIKPEYTIFMEPCKSGPIVHCDVNVKWTKGVMEKLSEDWRILRELHGHHRMIALHFDHQGAKHQKFLELMGFTYHHEVKDFEVWAIGE